MTRVYECKQFPIDVVLWGTYGCTKYDGTKITLQFDWFVDGDEEHKGCNTYDLTRPMVTVHD